MSENIQFKMENYTIFSTLLTGYQLIVTYHSRSGILHCFLGIFNNLIEYKNLIVNI